MKKTINLQEHLKQPLKKHAFFKLNTNFFPKNNAISKQIKHFILCFFNIKYLQSFRWPKPKNYPPFGTSPTNLNFGKPFKLIGQLFFIHSKSEHTLSLKNIPSDLSKDSIEYIGNMFGFKKEGTAFTNKKHALIKQPLVSILIPAHRHQFLIDAINSAINQTYKNVEILISDDSSNNDVENTVKKVNSPSINYLKSPELNNSAINHINLIKQCKGEYIKFLNDDDLLEPHCIETMVKTLNNQPEIGLVTSARQIVDEKLTHLKTYHLMKNSGVIERTYLIKLIYMYGNIIGEPTTTLFRKDHVLNQHFPNIFKIFNHYKFSGLAGDIRVWLSILLQSDMLYLNEPLSLFRQHKMQDQKKSSYISGAKQGHRILQKIIEDLGLIHLKNPKNVITTINIK